MEKYKKNITLVSSSGPYYELNIKKPLYDETVYIYNYRDHYMPLVPKLSGVTTPLGGRNVKDQSKRRNNKDKDKDNVKVKVKVEGKKGTRKNKQSKK